MARTFNGSNQYLIADLQLPIDTSGTSSALVPPVSLAGWFNSGSSTAVQAIVCMANNNGTNAGGGGAFYALEARGDVAGDPVRAGVYNGSQYGFANTSTGYSTSTWHHGCATFTNTTSRAVYIDGGSKGTDTTTVTGVGDGLNSIDSTEIGVLKRGGSLTEYFNGSIAEVGIWDVALTDDEAAALAKGYSPLLVRPGSLVFYAPLIGRASPELELLHTHQITGMTLVNTPTTSAHPRIIYPKRFQMPRPGSTVASSGARSFSVVIA